MTSNCKTAHEISRVLRSKNDAITTYDRLSMVYDLLGAGAERKYTSLGLQKLCVREGESILEIGFGPGRGILSLARSVGPGGSVLGIDISRGMIKAARSRIRDASMEGRVELMAGDGSRLPLLPGSVDAVFMSFVLELFDSPEIPEVLAESMRVLRKGGRICVVALSADGRRGPILRLYEWAHGQFPNYADCRPICVSGSMKTAEFEILSSEVFSMWGIPVGIVLARKP